MSQEILLLLETLGIDRGMLLIICLGLIMVAILLGVMPGDSPTGDHLGLHGRLEVGVDRSTRMAPGDMEHSKAILARHVRAQMREVRCAPTLIGWCSEDSRA